MTADITVERVDAALAVRFDSDAGDGLSLREWLVALARKVWQEGEGFSGKRPWGNSGWDWDPVPALINAGLLAGRLDEDGYVETVDERDLANLMAAALDRIAQP